MASVAVVLTGGGGGGGGRAVCVQSPTRDHEPGFISVIG
jgi:hypothetical protein